LRYCGARGLLDPELVVFGTRDTKAVLDAMPSDAYISANRTSEMGLMHATGRLTNRLSSCRIEPTAR